MRLCEVEGCGRKYLAHGCCGMHYHRLRKHGKVGAAATERVRGRLCSVEGCGRKHRARGYCDLHLRRLQTKGEPGPAHSLVGYGKGSVTTQGYRIIRRKGHPNAMKGGYIMEHTFVMSKMLGRPLLNGEQVHHKNGDRKDNRPENLELWASFQPSGTRVADKLADAIVLLAEYVGDDLLWGDAAEDVREFFKNRNRRGRRKRRATKKAAEQQSWF